MSWLYDPFGWTTGTIPSVTDFQHIATDIRTWGGNPDAARHGLANAAFATLAPQELPGTAYTVTAGSWSAGTATLTIGAHNIQAGQLVVVASVTPTGYNNTEAAVTAVTGTQISYALASNPGAWSSGGTVTAWGTPANGMLAVDASGNLNFRKSGTFNTITGGVAQVTTPAAWTAPTLTAGWSNFGSGWANAAYMRDGLGFVHVRLGITGTPFSNGTTLFTLPSGFRPPATVEIPVSGRDSGGTLPQPCILLIDSSGNVKLYDAAGGTLISGEFSFSTV